MTGVGRTFPGAGVVRALLVVAVFAGAFANGTHPLAHAAEKAPDNAADAIGGPFTMTDDTGRTVTQADFKGKPTVLYFGFTHCPDICPTTLFELSSLMKELGPDADRLNYAFVTVDPERDTPDVLEDYVAAFDPRIVGLTGTRHQTAMMAHEYHVFYRKVPTGDGDYTMDHTSTVYLMSADNKLVGTIGYREKDSVALQKLKNLIAKS